jgi:uncharacterized DUF497 family protein
MMAKAPKQSTAEERWTLLAYLNGQILSVSFTQDIP